MNKVHTVTYDESHEKIVLAGISAIKTVLEGNNSNEKEKLLFCLDKYLYPYYGYNLSYANDIFEMLEKIVIEPNTKNVKDEAIHLLETFSCPPFTIIEKNINKIESELIADIKYLLNIGKE